MTQTEIFFNNKAITLPIISWFLAQFIKFISHYIQNKKIDFRKFVASGGMPSSHSAITVCLATVMAINNGLNSSEFAISAIVSFIVMADAAGVRRAAGKQAEVLNKLVYHSKEIRLDKELRVLLGHTPIEVIAGAVLGMLVALLFA
ncbi:MAG TPA: divergent PAP2 family protein [Clostridiaceae bacterium]|nr:divergent PAP2 family protein [Clostridiaceae bacterium]